MHSTRSHITAPGVRGQGKAIPVDEDVTDRSRQAGGALEGFTLH